MTFQNMTTKDLLKNRHKKLLDKKVKLIVEVDDPDLHSTKIHKINDGVAKEFATEQMPQAYFCRLNKDEITTPIVEDRLVYFNRFLNPFVPTKRI